MIALRHFLSMGGYAIYVWAAYGLVFIGLALFSCYLFRQLHVLKGGQ